MFQIGGGYIFKICEECQQEFIPTHGNQKYCSNECARIAKKEQDRQARFKYRLTWGVNDRGNGTGCLGKHRNQDFDIEGTLVKSELKRYGLI